MANEMARSAIQVLVLTVILALSFGLICDLAWCGETILHDTVSLTSVDSPASKPYLFNLTGGDTISIEISVTGDPINFYIYNRTGAELLQKTNIMDLDMPNWSVPYNGTFEFFIETFAAESANAFVDITLTRVNAIPEFQYPLAVMLTISLIAVAIAKTSGDKHKNPNARPTQFRFQQVLMLLARTARAFTVSARLICLLDSPFF